MFTIWKEVQGVGRFAKNVTHNKVAASHLNSVGDFVELSLVTRAVASETTIHRRLFWNRSRGGDNGT